jgi:hypothetical protein
MKWNRQDDREGRRGGEKGEARRSGCSLWRPARCRRMRHGPATCAEVCLCVARRQVLFGVRHRTGAKHGPRRDRRRTAPA